MITKAVSLETLHSYLKGSGAKFAQDTLRSVVPQIKNASRRFRDQAYRDCGMKKVRGALGGVYWE